MADPLVGKLEVQDESGKTKMRIDPAIPAGNLEIINFEKVVASLGQEVRAGALRVSKGGTHSVHYLTGDGRVQFGSQQCNATLSMFGADGNLKINLNADRGSCHIGGNGKSGSLALFAADYKEPKGLEDAGKSTILLLASDASIRLGGNGANGDVNVFNRWGQKVIHLDGEAGDIVLENADCAEEFDVDDPTPEPGSVLVLSDEPGRLRVSDTPYDTRVAGILSGAGDYRPAIVLDRQPGREGRRPVALAGKVWCKVEAGSAPIRVGSLLTSSSLPGHAMAATDRERAFGAVIGKALAPLAAGVGVVPVLVALQ